MTCLPSRRLQPQRENTPGSQRPAMLRAPPAAPPSHRLVRARRRIVQTRMPRASDAYGTARPTAVPAPARQLGARTYSCRSQPALLPHAAPRVPAACGHLRAPYAWCPACLARTPPAPSPVPPRRSPDTSSLRSRSASVGNSVANSYSLASARVSADSTFATCAVRRSASGSLAISSSRDRDSSRTVFSPILSSCSATRVAAVLDGATTSTCPSSWYT
eukprot:2765122-Prymnesium_polylepis.1